MKVVVAVAIAKAAVLVVVVVVVVVVIVLLYLNATHFSSTYTEYLYKRESGCHSNLDQIAI